MTEKEIKNRALQPEEVEIRVEYHESKDGKYEPFVLFFAYIKKEVATSTLNELYGSDGYDKTLPLLDKKSADTPYYAICKIHIHDGTVDFVREDVGEGDTPKAASTDAFKRAATNIVPAFQALNTLPNMRVFAKDFAKKYAAEFGLKSSNDLEGLKKKLKYSSFKVNCIAFGTSVTGKFVKAIQIADEYSGTIVYEYVSSTREYRTELSEEQVSKLTELKEKMAEARISEQQMLDYYGISGLT